MGNDMEASELLSPALVYIVSNNSNAKINILPELAWRAVKMFIEKLIESTLTFEAK